MKNSDICLLKSSFICAIVLFFSASCAHMENDSKSSSAAAVAGYGEELFTIGDLLYQTDFSDKANWVLQIEAKDDPKLKERVSMANGILDLYMPAKGCTAWLKKKFTGPITITYEVFCPIETENGDSIQARDINNFWHCSDPKEYDAIFESTKTNYNGGFVSYHNMHGYYASTGGGGHVGNQTTRFRRYPRHLNNQDIPHIALNDKDGKEDYLITPGKWHTIQLVAYDGMAQYLMDGKIFYEIQYGDKIMVESREDGERVNTERFYNREDFPAHNEGYFGFRLVRTHHLYRNLKIYQLEPKNSNFAHL